MDESWEHAILEEEAIKMFCFLHLALREEGKC